MKLRQLGQNGPMIHPIGIGAMSFTNFYGETNEADSHAILDAAIEAGVNHIDTANIYGMGTSEDVIGSYFQKNPAAKDHFHIATKGSITRNPDGPGNIFNNTKEHLEAELEKSLKRMGVEAVDLYYIHRRDPNIPIEEVTETLASLVKSGKTKSIALPRWASCKPARSLAQQWLPSHPLGARC